MNNGRMHEWMSQSMTDFLFKIIKEIYTVVTSWNNSTISMLYNKTSASLKFRISFQNLSSFPFVTTVKKKITYIYIYIYIFKNNTFLKEHKSNFIQR